MTAERWHQVRDILYAASRMEGAARALYLDESCAADPALRHEVETLLSALDQSGEFLERGTRGSTSEAQITRIGPYLVLGQAGRGGMGVVYHAVRDDDYRQEVAIKLIQAGAETDFLIGRFRLERQALALLNHPNIARLLDGGTMPDGRPYLVMEWVEGRPITDYCQAQRLSLRERLKLFLEVGKAVEHAHRNLVVHRDLKPSNILINADGYPKLLDFGIAKIFAPEAGSESMTMTLPAGRMLTPDYASPEQVRGDVMTTATDVYSLGAVLYEILTGARPLTLETRTAAEVERVVCTQEPLPPSDATGPAGVPARELHGDLDNIVLKAIQKEPGRRYGSVDQFSDDIRRYLEGLPVIARKDTFGYRAGKFARRHRAGVVAAALVVIALSAGAAATLWEARVAVQQRARAERRFNDVRKLANSFLFEFDDAIKNLPGSVPARSLIVKRALEYLDGLAVEGRGDPSLQMEVASAYEKVAEVQGDPMYPNLGDSQGALASSRKSLAIREALAHADPQNRQLRLAIASVHQQISDILVVAGDSSGAIEHSGKALKIYQALAAKPPSDRRLDVELVIQTYHYANLLKGGDIDASLAAYQSAAGLSEKLIAAKPSDPAGKIHLASSLDGLGGVLQEKGNTTGALENRRKALAIREELAGAEPDNAHYRRQVGFSHHNVGLSLMQAGDLKQALEHFRYELSLFESLHNADPKDAQARRNLSLAHKQIGDVILQTADLQGALAEYRKALDIDRSLAAGDAANAQAVLDLTFSEGKVGAVLGRLKQTREALVILRKGLRSQELLVEKDPNNGLLTGYLGTSYSRLAYCLLESGDTASALEYYRKALATRLTLYAKNPGNSGNRGALAESYVNLGKALAPGDRAGALEAYNKAIDLLGSLTATDVNNAQYRVRLADAVTGAARLYSRMASATDLERSLRVAHWNKARSLYRQGQDLWLELDRGGKLAVTDRQRPQEVARELAGCENSLAKLLEH